jgi:hypothetical protein
MDISSAENVIDLHPAVSTKKKKTNFIFDTLLATDRSKRKSRGESPELPE